MGQATKKSNRLQTDEKGRIIWPAETEEERLARIKSALESIEAIKLMTDDDPPGASDLVFWKAMDEDRPDRPLFKDLY
ncbi:hypothetical protein TA3x_001000 [Tundrisphaera sp. TA3]|uniref:hypothetical protein n=1 Tax=Tundrisphaera sp. TA3 TaxID=3435775 RepID=UPI003EBBD84A